MSRCDQNARTTRNRADFGNPELPDLQTAVGVIASNAILAGPAAVSGVSGVVSDRDTLGADATAASCRGLRAEATGEDHACGPTHDGMGWTSDPLQAGTRSDLTEGAPTPTGSPASSTPSTTGKQPAATRGAVRALAEATLVARAQDGDIAAFERLALSYEGELVRFGFRMMSDLGEAQDAVQDTLVMVWRKLPTLNDTAAFRAWVYQLMTRRCLNLLRGRARRRTTVDVDEDLEGTRLVSAPEPWDGPAAEAQNQAMREGLSTALAELPAEQRACWVLHSLHDQSYPEIAYAIGVPVSTVRGRIARARVQLTKRMSAWQ